ncbi:MAG TPA: hypothetical protein VGF29_03050 [Hyphomicrobiaceae bacterium]|jgi:hypothetical protein
MTAEPEPTKVCARCKQDKPLTAFDGPERKNCSDCAAAEAARRKAPKEPKPEGWKAPKPGETPMQRCESCGVEKVYAAFPAGIRMCRECMASTRQPPAARADEGKRPTAYTPELGQAICERIAAREPLYAICADPSMPTERTLSKWRLAHEAFAEAYALAREARADARADRIDQYIDDLKTGRLDPHSAKVMIDAERWQAGKEMPGKYSDRVEVTGAGGAPLAQVNAAVAIEALIAALPDLMGGKAEAPKALTADPAPAESAEHKEAA